MTCIYMYVYMSCTRISTVKSLNYCIYIYKLPALDQLLNLLAMAPVFVAGKTSIQAFDFDTKSLAEQPAGCWRFSYVQLKKQQTHDSTCRESMRIIKR